MPPEFPTQEHLTAFFGQKTNCLDLSAKTSNIIFEALTFVLQNDKLALIFTRNFQTAQVISRRIRSFREQFPDLFFDRPEVLVREYNNNYRGLDPGEVFLDDIPFPKAREINEYFRPRVLLPEEKAPPGYHRHPNGGGLVEDTALVEEGVYLAKEAKVIGHSVVKSGAKINGNSLICDSTLFGTLVLDSWIKKSTVDRSSVNSSAILNSHLKNGEVSRSTVELSTIGLDAKITACMVKDSRVQAFVEFDACEVVSSKVQQGIYRYRRWDKGEETQVVLVKDFSYRPLETVESEKEKTMPLDEHTLIQKERELVDREIKISEISALLASKQQALDQERQELEEKEKTLYLRELRETSLGPHQKRVEEETDPKEDPHLEKDTKMSTEKFSAIKNTGGAMGAAILSGAKMAGANKLNDTIKDAAKRVLVKWGVDKEMLDTPAVDAVLKLTTPFVLHYVCEKYPQIVPGSEAIKHGAEKAIEAATFQVLMPLLADLGPELLEIKKQSEALVTDAPGLNESPKSDVIHDTINAKEPAPAHA